MPGLLLSCFFWSLRVMFTLVLSRRACLLLSVFSCPTSAPSFLVLSCYLVGACPVSSCLASSRLLWSCPLGASGRPPGADFGPLDGPLSPWASWEAGLPGPLGRLGAPKMLLFIKNFNENSSFLASWASWEAPGGPPGALPGPSRHARISSGHPLGPPGPPGAQKCLHFLYVF